MSATLQQSTEVAK